MQLPAAAGVGEQASSEPVPAPLHSHPLATKGRNNVCSQDEGDCYPVKKHDKLQTDGVLCPYLRWALSPVLPELPAVWGS